MENEEKISKRHIYIYNILIEMKGSVLSSRKGYYMGGVCFSRNIKRFCHVTGLNSCQLVMV